MSERYSSCQLAIIVVIFNMRREAPRTLYSLSPDYQHDVGSEDYDVIVVENGSSEPISPDEVAQFGSNFHYLRIDNASPSPAAAINRAVSKTSATYVGVVIDGARMASPGIIRLALKTLASFERPIVGTVAYHLGPDIQARSIKFGYNQEVEDKLLAGIHWRNDGYRLFDISALAPSSADRLTMIASRFAAKISPSLAKEILGVAGISESNFIFMSKALYEELQGFDERFDLPGGGLVNLDFYRRASELKDTTLITLSGEATFHQIHGGIMTNKTGLEAIEENETYRNQYEQIRGFPFETPARVVKCDVNPASLKIRILHGVFFAMRRFRGWLRKFI